MSKQQKFLEGVFAKHTDGSVLAKVKLADEHAQLAINSLILANELSDNSPGHYVEMMSVLDDALQKNGCSVFNDHERLLKAKNYFKMASPDNFKKFLPQYQALREELWAGVTL